MSLLGPIVSLNVIPKHQKLIVTVSFRILITGGTSGLVETITDAVSIHSIKKAEYARRIADGRFGHVTLFDHFKSVSIIFIDVSSFLSIHRPTEIRHLLNSLELSGILQNHWLVPSFLCDGSPFIETVFS